MAIDFPYVPKHCFAKNYSQSFWFYLSTHKLFSKTKKGWEKNNWSSVSVYNKKIAHQEQRAITYFDVLLDIDKHLHEIIKDGRSEKGDITVTLVS